MWTWLILFYPMMNHRQRAILASFLGLTEGLAWLLETDDDTPED